MDINVNLSEKLRELPSDIRFIGIQILKELERGKKSQAQIEDMILAEIRELIAEDER